MSVAVEAAEYLSTNRHHVEAVKRRLGMRGERFMEPRKPKQIEAPEETTKVVENRPKRLPFKIGRKRYVMILPEWMVSPNQCDDHMKLWRKYAGNRAACYIDARASEMGFSYDQIVGASRHRKETKARHIIAYELMATGRYTYPAVGRYLGGRDHTTILNSIRQVKEMIDRGEYVPQVAG